MVSEAFAAVLAARRTDYNAQFAVARRSAPELDDESFKAFLTTSVEPLISAVARVDPSALFEVSDVAYGVGLELVAQRLAGPRAHLTLLDQAFQQLFPELVRFVAHEPALLIPKLCNALQQLATTPGAHPVDWCAALSHLAPTIPDSATLLAVGQVAAWLCGLAQYRAGALELCQRLPAPLCAVLLRVSVEHLAVVLARLQREPWFVPSAPELGFRVVGSVGAFRGFAGGSFLAPPRALRLGRELFVQSGDDAWLLALDAFGCTFHRVRPDELGEAVSDVTVRGIAVEPMCVSAFGRALPLPDRGAVTSVAGSETTLLITHAHTYGVTVVALESGS
ncbi:MAG: hypothetical protein ABUL62_15100 [Myxococcales bacterium]